MPKLRNQTTLTGQTGSLTAIATSQAGTASVALILNGALAKTGQPVPSNAGTISQVKANGTSYLQPGAGLPISGTAAVLGAAQPVLIASAGNDSGITFKIVGLGPSGELISESLSGANVGTATSANLYSVVYSITPSAATAANVTVGTGSVVYSPWLIIGAQRNEFQTQVRTFFAPGGTGNYDLQGTTDIQIMNQVGGYADDIITLESAQTGNVSSFPNGPMMAYRLKMNSGGPVTLRILENRTA